MLKAPATADKGTQIGVKVSVGSGDQVAGIQSNLLFDQSVFGFSNHENLPGYQTCESSADQIAAGLATFVQACPTTNPTPDRLVLYLGVLSTAPAGQTSLILTNLKLFDVTGDELSSATAPATIEITTPVFGCGDVNGDGSVTRADVNVLINYIITGTGLSPDQRNRANVGPVKTDMLNAGDAVLIIRKADGLISSLNCGPFV